LRPVAEPHDQRLRGSGAAQSTSLCGSASAAADPRRIHRFACGRPLRSGRQSTRRIGARSVTQTPRAGGRRSVRRRRARVHAERRGARGKGTPDAAAVQVRRADAQRAPALSASSCAIVSPFLSVGCCGFRRFGRVAQDRSVIQQVEPGEDLLARGARVPARVIGSGGGQSSAGKQLERRPGSHDRKRARGLNPLALELSRVATGTLT
jgi:hypothetical protein